MGATMTVTMGNEMRVAASVLHNAITLARRTAEAAQSPVAERLGYLAVDIAKAMGQFGVVWDATDRKRMLDTVESLDWSAAWITAEIRAEAENLRGVLGRIGAQMEARRAKASRSRRERDGIMRDLGMVKVRGAVSGQTYWE